MVKAVNLDLDNEIKDATPKESTTPSVSIINPEDKVEFNIDFSEDSDTAKLATISEKAMGGTELMRMWLYEEVEKREAGLLDKFQLISTRVRELEDKPRILWIHDLAADPEVQHLKNKENIEKFERIVFVSHWQQYQFHVYLGFPYDRGVVIQNAIKPIPQHEKPKDGDKINVCYFSTPHRGLEVLLNAWDFMRNTLKDGLNAELNIYSSFQIYDRPHLDEQFRHIYKRARETKGVNYHGTVSNDEIRKALETQHIMAYPSIYEETSCITLIEASAAGCLSVVPNFGAIPETGANFPWMYGYEQDKDKHAQVHGHILGRAIEHFWDEDIQNLLKIQRSYFDMFYNWSLRSGQWQQFLHAIHDPQEIKLKDGTTS